MSTADPLPDNIRRIAVLVSSVDSPTARQLLLHLPTHVAKQVRRALQHLGPISPSERQRILAEFQSTAAKQNAPTANSSLSAASTARGAMNHDAPQYVSDSSVTAAHQPRSHSPSLAQYSDFDSNRLDPQHHSSNHTSPSQQSAHQSVSHSEQSVAGDSSQSAWARMDIRALSHFLRSERPTVIAVVINQLAPNTGVALLQQLPLSMHREVLQAIGSLQEFDSEAMLAIEEHLSERLKDYELRIDSESKGTRRIAALLAAAPPELQETWSRFVHIAVDPLDASVDQSETSAPDQPEIAPIQTAAPKNSVQPAARDTSTPVTASRTTERAAERAKPPTATSLEPRSQATFEALASQNTVVDTNTDDADKAYILPFLGTSEPKQLSDVDRSLIQLEFEQILSLTTYQLAQILTAANSSTVLLALAGASPNFMKRFYSMLNKADARALASRLSQIGPLKLRDIDEAQRSISELAAKLVAPRASSQQTGRSPSRVAA